MRAFATIGFLFLAACGTLPHALDDLSAVHAETADSFEHRFQVQRFGSFGSFLRFGGMGQLLGPLRYEQRSAEELTDPANFCAEHVRTVGDSGPGSGLYALESVYWLGKVLLADSYSLSRVFAGESLGAIGSEFWNENSWDRALLTPEGEYAGRVKLLAEELTHLVALQREGKGGAGDREKMRADLAELAAQRYAKPREDLVILRLILGIGATLSGEDRNACETAGRHLLARTLPRLLLAGLRDPNEFVREASLVALCRLGGDRTLAEALRLQTSETSVLVRRRLARLCGELTLAQACDPQKGHAIEFLLAANRDADGSLAAAARESLSRILKIEPRWDREFWKSWGEEYLLRGLPPKTETP